MLSAWPTGMEIDLDEVTEYLRKVPDEKNTSKMFKKAQQRGKTLVTARSGVALLEEQIKLFKSFQDDGGIDILPCSIDSHTRTNRYKESELAVEESKKEGRSMLNGFPAVYYGKKGCRQILEAVERPITARQGLVDGRLLAEITLAGGFTGIVGGPLYGYTGYSKDTPLETCINNYQYIDRLVGYYEDRGISIHRELNGHPIGVIMPPSIYITQTIMDILLAVEQGVKHVLFNYRHLGNIIQDIAAMNSEYRLCKEYLDKLGYRDVHVSAGFNQWLGPFPRDEAKAIAVICVGAMIAAYGGACQVIVKTTDEGFNLPRRDVNTFCIKMTKFILEILKNQRFPDCQEVATESKIIEIQVRSIIDKVLELGDGDLAVGGVKAFRSGLMDVVFPPNITIPGKILPIRDANGAIRFYECGNLPFPREVIEYEKEKLAGREKLEKRKADFEMVIRDIVNGIVWN